MAIFSQALNCDIQIHLQPELSFGCYFAAPGMSIALSRSAGVA